MKLADSTDEEVAGQLVAMVGLTIMTGGTLQNVVPLITDMIHEIRKAAKIPIEEEKDTKGQN